MNMDSRVRVSPQQFSTLLEYMESHGDLARPLSGAQGRIRSDRLWSDLTNVLNAVGGGVTKTTDKWKKVWADWKSKTKKKALDIKRHASRTGGGPASRQMLTAFDERVLAIIGPLAVEGQASVEELGFNMSSGGDAEAGASQYNLDLEMMGDLETIVEQPQLPSPPLSTPQPSTSRERPPVPLAPITTPRRWRLSVPRAPATPRPTTPATPQFVASPMRPTVRARRRRAQTPFDRAASQFVAVELRRLELEETRARQQHERGMRALEIEHERNQVFSSLVNIGQAWLDFVRSRENTEPLNTE